MDPDSPIFGKVAYKLTLSDADRPGLVPREPACGRPPLCGTQPLPANENTSTRGVQGGFG